MPEKDAQKTSPVPRWFSDDIADVFRANIAHTFIVYGDINGLIANPEADEDDQGAYISLKKFFGTVFNERELVIFYDIASGLRFLTKEMEQKFREVVGLNEKNDAKTANPVAAAAASLQAKRGLPREVDACLPLIEKALNGIDGVAVVIQSAHFIAPTTGEGVPLPPLERTNIERLKNWSQHEGIRKNGNIVLLVTDQLAKISSELRQSGNEIKPVFVPKPNYDERMRFIETITDGSETYRDGRKRLRALEQALKRTKKNSPSREDLERQIAEYEEGLANTGVFTIPKEFKAKQFAVATQGMNLRQILEIFLHAAKNKKAIDLAYVKEKKKEILNNEYGDVMEVVEPERGLDDIGGLEYIKKYLVNVLEAIRGGETRLVPMGITFMGPPGTGKTALVEALAYEAGFNFAKMKNLRSMWVGSSEAKGEKLIEGIETLKPMIIMNDEADLNDADRDSPKGDSGVSERLMKMWMEFISSPRIRGKVVIISCTNRPDRIDPALKRSGRSDERILVPMPSRDERPAIFKVMLKRHTIPTTLKDFSPYLEATEGISGADIEKIVLSAFRFAFERNAKSVDDAYLREAIEDFIPNASQADIDRMTLAAILECSSRRLLPPNIKEILAGIRERDLVPNLADALAQIKHRRIIDV